ncbi:receptor-type tyrosine-protein phosphatase H [Pelobates fuscus]
MAFFMIKPDQCKVACLLLLILLIWHGGTTAFAQTVPMVTNVTASNISTSSLTLEWTVPDVTHSYTYHIIVLNGSTTVNTYTTDINATRYPVDGLYPGVTYTFNISTNFSGNLSDPASKEFTTYPSAVSNVNITGSTTTTLTLTWIDPNDINRDTYSYKIKVSNGSNSWDIITDRNVTSKEVQNLLPGVNYTFTINTLTINNKSSSDSPPVTGTTNPSALSKVNITNSTTTTLTLTWIDPNDINRDTYSYKIKVSNGSNSWDIITDQNVTSKEVQNLLPGVNYTFAINTLTINKKSSSDSPPVTGTTNPSALSNVNITGSTTTTLTLTWIDPNDINRETYSYKFKVSNGSNSWDIIPDQNVTSKEVQNLLPGVNYTFTINTLTINNIPSSDSPPVTGTTNPSAVSNVNITGSTTTTLTLTWIDPNDINRDTYSYKIKLSNGSNSWDIITDQNVTSKEVQNLLPGVNYTFTINTLTINNKPSSDSPPVTGTTNPSALSKVNITGSTTTTLTLTWIDPNDINRDTYSYKIKVSNGSNSGDIITDQNVTSKEVQNLLPGVNYTFTINTLTINNIPSSDSPPVTGTTNPSALSKVNITGSTTTTLTLTWIDPNDINRDTYSYKIKVSNGSNSWDIITDQNVTSKEVLNLLPGVNYTFTINTLTINNKSSSDSPPVTGTTNPNQPTNLNGSAVNTTTISVSWNAPSDPNVKLYKYHVICSLINGTNTTTEETNSTNTLISSLSSGSLYNVFIYSLINHVESVASQILLQTKPEIANDLSIKNITSTNVSFSWICPPRATGVQIKATTGGKTKNEVNQTCSPGVNEYKLENLIPGNFYEFSLRTFTTTNASSRRRRRSPTDSITTYSEPYIKTEQMEPATASNLECSKIAGGYGLKVSFSCPKGNVSKLNIMVDNSEKKTITDCTGSTTVDGLQPAYGYNIVVQTVAEPKIAFSDSKICRTDDVGVIVGAIVGVLLFLLLVGLIAFFILKKRRSKDPNILMPVKLSQKRSHTITKEQFQDYYQKNHADSDFGFAEEYQELSAVGTKQSKRAAENPENRAKNRFTNVLPYDHSRVKLDCIDGNPNSDYINANYMPGYTSNKEFIASQGPLPNTTADFWRMIWEHHVNTIVMLTNCMENGRVKCEHYWPLDYTPCTYEDITVTVTSETILTEWTIRDFSLKNARQQGVKYVRHFHFTVWPDHGVPENTTNIIQFRNLVREHMDQRKSTGPTIVHCSAGVGRTGTLIALDYLIQQMEKEHRIGVYGFVEKMRMNRPLMVQTESQYVFLNKCLLSLIEQPAEENIYENNVNDLIYENASVIRNFNNENA